MYEVAIERIQISIHALTRSATGADRFPHPHIEISIHALTRSATGNGSPVVYATNISIHALTRSATLRHRVIW